MLAPWQRIMHASGLLAVDGSGRITILLYACALASKEKRAASIMVVAYVFTGYLCNSRDCLFLFVVCIRRLNEEDNKSVSNSYILVIDIYMVGFVIIVMFPSLHRLPLFFGLLTSVVN